MDEIQIKAALADFGTQERAKFDLLKTATEAEATALKAEIAILRADAVKAQAQLDANSTELIKLKKEVPKSVVTFAQELRQKLTAEAVALKGMSENKVASLQLEIKSFLETANASITTGALIPTPQFEAGISKAPDRPIFMMDIITTGFSNALTIYWTYRKTRDDNGGSVTEGTITKVATGDISQSVLGWDTASASMKNLLSFIKVSNNAIDDIEWLASEVQTELLTLMALMLDAYLLTGTTGTCGFDGVLTVATAFAAGGTTLKAGVVPNNYDALKFAATQIKKAHFRPNYVILHPDDVLAMELERDERGAYLFPPYLNVQPQFAGVRIIENTGITSGTYLIGDFTKAKFWIRKGFDLKIHDQNDDDAVKQLKTITLYSRGTLVVKTADRLAFVTDTFTDTIAEITLQGS